VAALHPDARTRRVHYDWLEAGEHTQRTVAQLSQQLRRFLDDQAWLENRRIMDILHGIEAKALALRDTPPPGAVMEIPESAAAVELPMERPLFTPARKPLIADVALEAGDSDCDAAGLYAQIMVDRAALAHHIRHALQDRAQVTLRELTQSRPLQQGLAELVAYLQLGSDSFKIVVDEDTPEVIAWPALTTGGDAMERCARLPRVIFVR
jgi:hypothetical protein